MSVAVGFTHIHIPPPTNNITLLYLMQKCEPQRPMAETIMFGILIKLHHARCWSRMVTREAADGVTTLSLE